MAEELFGSTLFTAVEREDPAAGMLLVAAPGLDNEFLTRSVVLLLEYSHRFTVGINLTARSETAVFNVLPEWASFAAKPQAIYIGGVLEQQAVLGIGVTATGVDIVAEPHLDRIANRLAMVDLQADPEAMRSKLDGMRFFAGFMQWQPGELEAEIESGDWFVTPALPSDVIAPSNIDVWGEIMRRQGMPLAVYSTFPENINDN
ncbi:Uncharacterized ACR, COG1678 [Corynebacterium kutscheri]|uniref:Putative transcriptional regulator n=1 Tax=Corynebacterium kutscheri TaxID=35755 RepID=A0A0F6R1E6_9CORY|nr:YqgE/AlgH family protein [Corynebacterium kutscheri]AKE42277.1 putative transcriptional regulator [Corynebacterium kutscheri]VEH05624.1 Uncharacterized ACR, COG1678 [Corynebacterium kutscheri]VEH10621.1 Uncharacterized ACR, COG1678 [Corynebacterium kutscheri]VEH81518.1 Uncharacterized ACR, COG1678 [Corynebacterium kutscheri]